MDDEMLIEEILSGCGEQLTDEFLEEYAILQKELAEESLEDMYW